MSDTAKSLWATIRKPTNRLYDREITKEQFQKEFQTIIGTTESLTTSDVVSILTWAFDKKLKTNEAFVALADKDTTVISSLKKQIKEKESQLESATKLPESDNKQELLNKIRANLQELKNALELNKSKHSVGGTDLMFTFGKYII